MPSDPATTQPCWSVCESDSASGWWPWNTRSTTVIASGPLTRTTARPAAPGAVAIAAMVSFVVNAVMRGSRAENESSRARERSPAREHSRELVLRPGGLRIVRRSDGHAFDEPRPERVRLHPLVGLQRDVDDPPFLRVQVLGDDLGLARQRLVGHPARQLLQLALALFPEVVDLQLEMVGRR